MDGLYAASFPENRRQQKTPRQRTPFVSYREYRPSITCEKISKFLWIPLVEYDDDLYGGGCLFAVDDQHVRMVFTAERKRRL